MMRFLRISDYVFCLKCSDKWTCVDESEEKVEEFSDLGEALKWYFDDSYIGHEVRDDVVVVETKFGVVKLSNIL